MTEQPLADRQTPVLDATEQRLLDLLAQGSTVIEAARELGLSPRTTHRRLEHARATLGVSSNAEAIVLALQTQPPATPTPTP